MERRPSDRRRPPSDRDPNRRPTGGSPASRRPSSESPAGRRPAGERPTGRRPASDRPAGRRPASERPADRRPLERELSNIENDDRSFLEGDSSNRESDARRRARAEARAKYRAAQKRKRLIILSALALLIILIIFSIVRCATASGDENGNGNDNETNGVSTENGEMNDGEQEPAQPGLIPQSNREVYNRDGVVIYFIGFEDDFMGMNVRFDIRNDGDTPITVQPAEVSVNGYMISGVMSEDVMPDSTTNAAVTLLNSDLETIGIETVDTVEMRFNIVDTDTWEPIHLSDVITVRN